MVAKAKQCGDEALEHLVSLGSGNGSGNPEAAAGSDGTTGGSGAVWLVGYHTHESMLKKDPTEVWSEVWTEVWSEVWSEV